MAKTGTNRTQTGGKSGGKGYSKGKRGMGAKTAKKFGAKGGGSSSGG